MQELRNERVDIIPWSEDEADFLIRSLNPARVEAIIMNFDERTATAIVSEDQLSLAIGRQGRNVSLAARLTGWRIDIRTPERLGRVIPPEEPKSPEPAAPQETTAELAPEAIAPSEETAEAVTVQTASEAQLQSTEGASSEGMGDEAGQEAPQGAN
jgi:N utilization substance protein A